MGMRVEALVFLLVSVLFAVTDAGYWYFSHDPTGTTALGILVGMGLIIGFYLLFTGRRTGERPEDDPAGDIAEGAGEYGFYSPYSWWPAWLGAAVTLTGLGVAVAWWLAIAGLMGVVLATIGMVFEYYRGEFAH